MRPGGRRGGGQPLAGAGGFAKSWGGGCVAGGREYLTGFHKRKVERRKAALEEIKRKLKEEQRKMKEEVPTQTPPDPPWEKRPPPPPAVAGWGRDRPRGRRGLRASPAPPAGGRGRPGQRVGGGSGGGAAVTRFPPSAAPGVPEDAEREGGGARYVLGPRQRGGCGRGGGCLSSGGFG